MKSSLETLTHKILSPEEENRLGRIVRDSEVNSPEYDDAFSVLINHNLRLVAKEAANFSKKTGVDIQDLLSEGYLGLVHAIEKYDPDKSNNARFATYASYWIQQKIRLYLAKNTIAHVPNYLIQEVVKYKKLLSENTEKELTREEIKESMDIDDGMLTLVEQANVQSISLSFVIEGESTTKEITIGETLREEKIKNPDVSAMGNDETRLIDLAVSELSEMDRDIIFSQYLEDDKITLKEIGIKYNLSAERIRQLKQKALSTLREKLKVLQEKELA